MFKKSQDNPPFRQPRNAVLLATLIVSEIFFLSAPARATGLRKVAHLCAAIVGSLRDRDIRGLIDTPRIERLQDKVDTHYKDVDAVDLATNVDEIFNDNDIEVFNNLSARSQAAIIQERPYFFSRRQLQGFQRALWFNNFDENDIDKDQWDWMRRVVNTQIKKWDMIAAGAPYFESVRAKQKAHERLRDFIQNTSSQVSDAFDFLLNFIQLIAFTENPADEDRAYFSYLADFFTGKINADQMFVLKHMFQERERMLTSVSRRQRLTFPLGQPTLHQ